MLFRISRMFAERRDGFVERTSNIHRRKTIRSTVLVRGKIDESRGID